MLERDVSVAFFGESYLFAGTIVNDEYDFISQVIADTG